MSFIIQRCSDNNKLLIFYSKPSQECYQHFKEHIHLLQLSEAVMWKETSQAN